jgi:copper chaperone CopZ
VDGVTRVKVSYRKGMADITFDSSKTTPEAIAKAVMEKSGFRAQVLKPR